MREKNGGIFLAKKMNFRFLFKIKIEFSVYFQKINLSKKSFFH